MRTTPLAAVFAGLLSVAVATAAGYAPIRSTIVRTMPSFTAAQDNRVGVNLPDVSAPGNTVPIFVDAMKQSLPWSSSTLTRLALDRDGNVVSLQRGQYALTTIYRGSAYPSGIYTLLYDGTGTFEISQLSGTVVTRAPGRMTVAIRSNPATGIQLRLSQVSATDYPRNIRLILPGFESTYAQHPFNPAFVQMLRQYNVLRFANWTHAGTYAESAGWPIRTTTHSFTQGGDAGVAVEYMIDLANETGTDPWFAIPAGATDYWVKSFVQLLAQHLDPRLHPLVEYGDEMWKAGTPANAWAWMAARNYGLRSDVEWYTRRSAIIFGLVQQTYGAPGRFVRVLSGPMPSRTGSALATDTAILTKADALHEMDAFAVSGADPGTPAEPYAQVMASANGLAQAHRVSLLAYDGAPSVGAPLLFANQLETWHSTGGKAFVAPPLFGAFDAASRAALLQYSVRHAAPRIVPGQFPLLLSPAPVEEVRPPVRAPSKPPRQSAVPVRKPYAVRRLLSTAASQFRINAGGPDVGNWYMDSSFSNGNVSATTQTAIDTSAVTNPAPMNVYQSSRIDNFKYILVGLQPNSSYTVRLHFAEYVFNGPNQRLFNVLIQGTQVLTNFDIYAAAGGEFKAVVEEFPVTSDATGQILIQFISTVMSAQVNGVELVPGPGVPTPAPTPTPTPPPVNVTGKIVSIGTSRFEIQGPPSCGYTWVNYNFQTAFNPPGWQPVVGDSVTVQGGGSCITAISASLVTDNGVATATPIPTPTPPPTPTPTPTPTPNPTPTPAFLVSGTIVALATPAPTPTPMPSATPGPITSSRFQISSAQCPNAWITYTTSTKWYPPGAAPAVGENVTVGAGTGTTCAAITATSVTVNGASGSDVLTYQHDNQRTGWTNNEVILNTTNVASTNFGALSTITVDGEVMAQPLYVGHYQLPNGGGTRNLLIVATEHNSVYALDADTGLTIWQKSMGTSQFFGDIGCGDVQPEYGITATPVIVRNGPGSGTIYVVAATENQSMNFHTWVRALDIGTGADQHIPREIFPSARLTNGALVKFDPKAQLIRPALTWANNSLYVAIGSHCDANNATSSGWLLRYDSNLTLINQFNSIDDPAPLELASIWMGGFGPAVDAAGNLYAVTGNGAFDANTAGKNFGQSILKWSPSLAVTSYFTPKDWNTWNPQDWDFGSGGALLVPAGASSDVVAMGKSGTMYLTQSMNLGGFSTTDAGAVQVIQDTSGSGTEPGIWGGPALYSPAAGTTYVYYELNHGPLEQYLFNGSALSLFKTALSSGGYGGTTPAVSSNGNAPGSAIVWAVKRSLPLTLEAYDATDVTKKLKSLSAGTWNTGRGNAFVTPLVVNGRVYVGAAGTLKVYGLKTPMILKSGMRALPPMRPYINANILPSTPVRRVSTSPLSISGFIVKHTANTLTLRRRYGSYVTVDISQAVTAHRAGVLPRGGPVLVSGYRGIDGKLHVTMIDHNSSLPVDWGPDTGI